MSSLKQRLATGAKKAGATALIGGGLSIVFMGGLGSVKVLGTNLPKFAVQAGALGVSSYATDLLVPTVVPWISSKAGMNPQLAKWEGIVLQPLLAGLTVMAVETILAPEAIKDVGGPLKAVLSGAGSSVVSYYLLDSAGIIKN